MVHRRRSSRVVTLVGAVVLALVVAGCDSGGGSNAARPTTTTTVADPSGLGRSTSTPEAGGIVETSFPTRQGRPLVEPPVVRSVGGVLRTTFDVHEATYDVAGQQVRGKTSSEPIGGPRSVR